MDIRANCYSLNGYLGPYFCSFDYEGEGYLFQGYDDSDAIQHAIFALKSLGFKGNFRVFHGIRLVKK